MPDLKPVIKKTEKFLKEGAAPLAVFDADGTLWKQDANHLLLNYQIENNLRNLSDLLSPIWKGEKQRGERCGEFVRRQAGLSLREIKQQFKEVLKSESFEMFSFQKDLMSHFKEKGMKIFIVTASMQWLVEDIVDQHNLPVDKVLGVQVKLDRDILTDELIFPVTYGEGKKQAFLRETDNRPPLFVAGNSPGDLHLLEMASVGFVINSASPQNERNFHGEREMNHLAQKRGWFLLDFLKKAVGC